MRPALKIGLVAALATLALDQASKLYLLFVYGLPAHYPVSLTSWFDLTVVWNRGISYGLFQQETVLGRWLLTGFQIVAALALAVWMVRTYGKMTALGLGLIVGGAIGNAIDRIAYGAVFDFAHLHSGSFSWYVFNLADAAIVLGVPCLLYPEPKRQ